ncbi:acyltransferase [Pseudoalteromonas shioyasakiensis]|uniref:acyltransferase n=1 Tax=Pseudoalteromonas shioyasakiensis TaxID=1190813 RepID=UPI002551EF73|nr:acyltransferase [Pseudoalteromonas shioyasakiensis]MDK9684921.1 acyltransferase [Pseudoalteromonas shioyasakiensis]
MSGRQVFKYFKPILLILIYILKVLPPFVRRFLFDVSSSIPTRLGVLFRYILIKSLAKKCGDNVYIGRWVTIKNIDMLSLSDNVSVHEYCYIDAQGGIDIGREVSIAHNCSLISFEHTFEAQDTPIKYQPLKNKQIIIKNNVWLGCGIRVLAGTVIGEKAVIAANSVTKGELEGGYIYAGLPAKAVKSI